MGRIKELLETQPVTEPLGPTLTNDQFRWEVESADAFLVVKVLHRLDPETGIWRPVKVNGDPVRITVVVRPGLGRYIP